MKTIDREGFPMAMTPKSTWNLNYGWKYVQDYCTKSKSSRHDVYKNGHTIVRRTFYKKEISSPLVFHSKGAHCLQTKLVTLVEELRRRFRNVDVWHNEGENVNIMKKFVVDD